MSFLKDWRIEQSTGQSPLQVMSQKSITDAIEGVLPSEGEAGNVLKLDDDLNPVWGDAGGGGKLYQHSLILDRANANTHITATIINRSANAIQSFADLVDSLNGHGHTTQQTALSVSGSFSISGEFRIIVSMFASDSSTISAVNIDISTSTMGSRNMTSFDTINDTVVEL